jgi:site-specific DNA recombinase
VGYRNIEGPDERRVIVPDNDAATVTRLFDEFVTGQYSLKTLVAKCKTEGWTIRGRRIATSTLHQILRKRIYTGDFDWDGVTYAGRHDALVSRETWDRVQALIDKRIETRQHRHQARLHVHRLRSLRPLRMPARRRVEEGKVRLLPLHRPPRKMR